MTLSRLLSLLGLAAVSLPVCAVEKPAGDCVLWYREPARVWEEALPVGNGHLGAMVFGKPESEQIQFNEYTVWTGGPRSYAHQG
ncbi:MAG: glycoside hydrolase N-terminal domain-containing protein, partial [Kiritimatiellia bacterium]